MPVSTKIKSKTKTLSAYQKVDAKRSALRNNTKVTFVLPTALASEVKQAVVTGAFESQNALVRTAIEHEMKKLREDEISRAYAEAAQDPLYMADLQENMDHWKLLDADANQFLDTQFDDSQNPSKADNRKERRSAK